MAIQEDNEAKVVIKVVACVIVGLILLVGGCRSFVTVPSGHRGVVSFFGKVQDRVLDEGFHLVNPLGTAVYEMSVKVQKDNVQVSAASKDLQMVTGDIAVNWVVDSKKVNAMFQSIGTLSVLVENLMAPAVNEVFKAITAGYSAEEILTKRGELKDRLDRELIARLEKYDVKVMDASIVHIDFSKEFNDAIESKQIAEQRSQQAKYEADQAKQMADAEINRARGKAEGMRLMALTVSDKVLQQQALEKWDGHLPQIMGSGTMPFINAVLKPVAGAQ